MIPNHTAPLQAETLCHHCDAASTPFSLSVLTATRGNASKRLVPDAHGHPIKDPSHSLSISAGRIEHVQVDGLAGFGELLKRITPQQALVHGIPKGSKPGDILTLLTSDKYNGKPGTIARTLDCIAYPDVFLLMADYDPEPEAASILTSAKELVVRLADVWDAFKSAGWLATTSTSSAIRSKADGEWLKPPEGMHAYFLATGDVARFKDILNVRLWLAGTGYCKLSTPNRHTGVAAVLQRCLVDMTVFSPERLDFVAGAKIAKNAPFYQDRPEPELHTGCILNLDSMPDLTDSERDDYQRLVDEAKSHVTPERRAVVRNHIKTTTPDAADTEVEREIDRRFDLAERGELEADHPLYFDNGIHCTAGTLSAKNDGKRLSDPIEPDYGRSQAVHHWRGGDWRIVSWAHGVKRVYRSSTPTPTATTSEMVPGQPPPGAKRALPTPPLSDVVNAESLVEEHGEDLRYCHPWGKWLVWTGTHWREDNTGEVMRRCKATVKDIMRRATYVDDEGVFASMMAHAKTSLSSAKLSAMATVAQSEPGIPILPEDLDADPWLLNCQNGTLDLRTGDLKPHDRANLLTKIIPVEYGPIAACPVFDAFMWRIMGGTVAADSPDDSAAEFEARAAADERAKRLIRFLQKAIGYGLTGDVREQVLLILWGVGANGKSTFLNTIMKILGIYAMKATSELLMVSNSDRHPTERADLFGKRFVSAIETEEGRRLSEVFVKEATGGDPIRARRMREDFWQFNPTHKVFLATNHKPVIKGTDHAIWRRIRLIPFTTVIPDEEQDKNLPEKLEQELPGILRWAVEGCLAWQREGLGEPEAIKAATAEYRREMDIVGQFIEECCFVNPDPGVKVKASNLYKAYQEWCEAGGESALTQRRFGQSLTERGYERHTNNGVWYRGIGLHNQENNGTFEKKGSVSQGIEF